MRSRPSEEEAVAGGASLATVVVAEEEAVADMLRFRLQLYLQPAIR